MATKKEKTVKFSWSLVIDVINAILSIASYLKDWHDDRKEQRKNQTLQNLS